MARKGQKLQKYERSFKELVVHRFLNEQYSYRDLSKEYGIPIGTINTWVYKYRKEGEVPRGKPGRPVPGTETEYREKYEILKKFLAFCEKVDHQKK